jgi:hypothetical protein
MQRDGSHNYSIWVDFGYMLLTEAPIKAWRYAPGDMPERPPSSCINTLQLALLRPTKTDSLQKVLSQLLRGTVHRDGHAPSQPLANLLRNVA